MGWGCGEVSSHEVTLPNYYLPDGIVRVSRSFMNQQMTPAKSEASGSLTLPNVPAVCQQSTFENVKNSLRSACIHPHMANQIPWALNQPRQEEEWKTTRRMQGGPSMRITAPGFDSSFLDNSFASRQR